ncbi:MAG TPA: Mur ligase family protein, partial [Ktedonobacteraceae bacterium]|nr:Mur ligase family protein [Ktedonobacteraceae bacterium]
MQEKRPSRPESREARRERRASGKKLARTAETGEPEVVEAHSTEQAPISEAEQQELALPGEETTPASDEPVELSESEQKTVPPEPFRKRNRRNRNTLRASLAVVGGRTAGALSRRLRLGGGTSIAGVVAQRLYPDIVEHLSTQLQQGSVLVTGTNGKTTTSGFIAAILSDAGLRVWRNREGSNLMRGIAGALVIRTLPNGRLRRGGQAISIFEVDEAVMPHAVRTLPTRVAVFTNLFRDQLDRYGEVDTVLEHWKQSIRALSPETILVLNADDPTVAALGKQFTGRVIYFGIEDGNLALENQEGSGERHQVIDTHACPICGEEYNYSLRFYSHIGHYSCPQCGYSRPQTAVRATRIANESFDRLRIAVETVSAAGEIVVPLPGLYNIYNALAAIAAAQALNIAWAP